MRSIVLAAAAVLAFSSQVPVMASECPTVVTAAALSAHAGASVTACKQEREHGATRYEVKLATGTGPIELDVSPEGKILLTEESVAVADVPRAVLAAFDAKHAGAQPTRAEKQTAGDGKVTYEIAFSVGSKKKESTFTAEGVLLEEE